MNDHHFYLVDFNAGPDTKWFWKKKSYVFCWIPGSSTTDSRISMSWRLFQDSKRTSSTDSSKFIRLSFQKRAHEDSKPSTSYYQVAPMIKGTYEWELEALDLRTCQRDIFDPSKCFKRFEWFRISDQRKRLGLVLLPLPYLQNFYERSLYVQYL